MENGLFRKKSMERISSPEELHDYMRVTSPRLWMILGAIVALLVGFIVYASTATMENTMPITVSLTQYEIPEEEEVSEETGEAEGAVTEDGVIESIESAEGGNTSEVAESVEGEGSADGPTGLRPTTPRQRQPRSRNIRQRAGRSHRQGHGRRGPVNNLHS